MSIEVPNFTVKNVSKDTKKLVVEYIDKCRSLPCINCSESEKRLFTNITKTTTWEELGIVEVTCSNCNHIMHYRLSKELTERLKNKK